MNACATLITAALLGAGLYAEELTADQIGQMAAQADIDATAALRDYTVVRHIVLDNPRFNKHAEMTMRVTYHAGAGKTFEILETKNAEGMQKKVFQKLIEAEKESSQKKNVDEMRIGPRNYAFELVGTEKRDGRLCYVLELKPKRKNKYLVEGRAWVSADDFGIVHVEGRPADRISFWVGKPAIRQSFCKVGPVWMMASNHSSADVKLIGKSELSIDSSDFSVRYMDHEQIARAAAPGKKGRAISE